MKSKNTYRVDVVGKIANLSKAALATLYAIYSFKNYSNGNCYPSIEKIASRCNYSQRRIITAINELRDKHVVTSEPRYTIDKRGKKHHVSTYYFFTPIDKLAEIYHNDQNTGGSDDDNGTGNNGTNCDNIHNTDTAQDTTQVKNNAITNVDFTPFQQNSSAIQCAGKVKNETIIACDIPLSSAINSGAHEVELSSQLINNNYIYDFDLSAAGFGTSGETAGNTTENYDFCENSEAAIAANVPLNGSLANAKRLLAEKKNENREPERVEPTASVSAPNCTLSELLARCELEKFRAEFGIENAKLLENVSVSVHHNWCAPISVQRHACALERDWCTREPEPLHRLGSVRALFEPSCAADPRPSRVPRSLPVQRRQERRESR